MAKLTRNEVACLCYWCGKQLAAVVLHLATELVMVLWLSPLAGR